MGCIRGSVQPSKKGVNMPTSHICAWSEWGHVRGGEDHRYLAVRGAVSILFKIGHFRTIAGLIKSRGLRGRLVGSETHTGLTLFAFVPIASAPEGRALSRSNTKGADLGTK